MTESWVRLCFHEEEQEEEEQEATLGKFEQSKPMLKLRKRRIKLTKVE